MKDFVKEFDKFLDKIKKDEKFCLIRFADGEGSIIKNDPQWIKRKRESAAWEHIIGNPVHEEFRKKLTESLQYNDENYYIGIPCKEDHQTRFHYLFEYLKGMTQIPEEQLTFATIFKDANWKRFLSEFMPLVTSKECYLIANEYAKMPAESWLQFREIITVPKENAHLFWEETLQKITNLIETKNINNAIFLFASGPGTNVIAHSLWKTHKTNMYIDIGSTIDSYLFRHSPCKGKSRVYIRKDGKGYKPWKWG
jgi:hypothetical protein